MAPSTAQTAVKSTRTHRRLVICARRTLPGTVMPLVLLAACQDNPTDPTIDPGSPSVPAQPSAHSGTTNDGRTNIVYHSPADFALVGHAQVVGDAVRLTSAGVNQAGAAWLRSKQSLIGGFRAEFHFRINPEGCFPADGLAFVIHNAASGPGSLGSFGFGLGYHGIASGLAVEFDTWYNPELADPNANHVAVLSGGSGALSAHHSFALGQAFPGVQLASNTRLRAIVDYRPGTLDVYLGNGAAPLLRTSTTLTNVRGGSVLDAEGMAWVGFTAGTGGACESHFIEILPNTAPTAAAGGPYTVEEGVQVTLTAAGSADADGDGLSYAWDTDSDGEFDDGADVTVVAVYGNEGQYAPRVQVTDSHGAVRTAAAQVIVTNVAPTATFTAPVRVDEGTSIALDLSSAIDVSVDMPELRFAFDCGTGSGYGDFGEAATASCTTTDNATRTVRGKVRDDDGGVSEYTTSVTIDNVAPAISHVRGPLDPIGLVGGTATAVVDVEFADAGTGDTHTTSLACGGSGVAVSSTTCTYGAAGVYTVVATVTDDDGGSHSRSYQYIVVYDPSAGFVTGGGWITYGSGSCPVLCGGAAGRADFGFVSKYLKGASTPSGDTRFEFHAGALRFVSTSYEWLVVTPGRAQFKGRGTINGGGDFGFLLTAVDGSPDRFRIKVWDRTTAGNEENTVFDNGVETSLDKVSGGGSIVIHSR